VVSILRREGAAAGRPSRLTASIKAPKLSPGRYRLEVQVTGAGGTHSSSTAFVVAGR
jgi:hypothetical protein